MKETGGYGELPELLPKERPARKKNQDRSELEFDKEEKREESPKKESKKEIIKRQEVNLLKERADSLIEKFRSSVTEDQGTVMVGVSDVRETIDGLRDVYDRIIGVYGNSSAKDNNQIQREYAVKNLTLENLRDFFDNERANPDNAVTLSGPSAEKILGSIVEINKSAGSEKKLATLPTKEMNQRPKNEQAPEADAQSPHKQPSREEGAPVVAHESASKTPFTKESFYNEIREMGGIHVGKPDEHRLKGAEEIIRVTEENLAYLKSDAFKKMSPDEQRREIFTILQEAPTEGGFSGALRDLFELEGILPDSKRARQPEEKPEEKAQKAKTEKAPATAQTKEQPAVPKVENRSSEDFLAKIFKGVTTEKELFGAMDFESKNSRLFSSDDPKMRIDLGNKKIASAYFELQEQFIRFKSPEFQAMSVAERRREVSGKFQRMPKVFQDTVVRVLENEHLLDQISREIAKQLAAFGLSGNTISKLKPEEALEILKSRKTEMPAQTASEAEKATPQGAPQKEAQPQHQAQPESTPPAPSPSAPSVEDIFFSSPERPVTGKEEQRQIDQFDITAALDKDRRFAAFLAKFPHAQTRILFNEKVKAYDIHFMYENLPHTCDVIVEMVKTQPILIGLEQAVIAPDAKSIGAIRSRLEKLAFANPEKFHEIVQNITQSESLDKQHLDLINEIRAVTKGKDLEAQLADMKEALRMVEQDKAGFEDSSKVFGGAFLTFLNNKTKWRNRLDIRKKAKDLGVTEKNLPFYHRAQIQRANNKIKELTEAIEKLQPLSSKRTAIESLFTHVAAARGDALREFVNAEEMAGFFHEEIIRIIQGAAVSQGQRTKDVAKAAELVEKIERNQGDPLIEQIKNSLGGVEESVFAGLKTAMRADMEKFVSQEAKKGNLFKSGWLGGIEAMIGEYKRKNDLEQVSSDRLDRFFNEAFSEFAEKTADPDERLILTAAALKFSQS